MAFMTAPHARAKPEAVALRDERGQVSWAELDRRINRMIRAFQACGLKPGDRIALFAGNSREVFELMIAAGHAGLSYVPVNWHFTVDELAYVLQDCEAKGVFTDLQFAPIAIEALRRVPAAGTCLKLIAPVGEATSASTTHAVDRTALDQPALDRAALDRVAPEGWTWF